MDGRRDSSLRQPEGLWHARSMFWGISAKKELFPWVPGGSKDLRVVLCPLEASGKAANCLLPGLELLQHCPPLSSCPLLSVQI